MSYPRNVSSPPRLQPRAHPRRPTWALVGAGGVLAAIGIVAALGGFADTPITKVPTIAIGEVYEGQQIDVSIEGAEVGRQTAFLTADDGEQLVIVSALVVNRADVPVSNRAIQLVVLMGDVRLLEDPDAIVTPRDGETVGSLQPGVPTLLQYVWRTRGDVASGDDAVVGIYEAVPDPNDIYDPGQLGLPNPVRRIELVLA